jgi:phosphoribosyl-AMP cyclohydrolase / phosphoribosyl-ATP pyrophosphohydrolase
MNLDFSKGLIPAIVQDYTTSTVLMLGYMNEEAFSKTQASGKVTFFSRSKNRLWVKGETSGNYLLVKSITADCDNDTVLIKAIPEGPVCHTGSDTCFNEKNIRQGVFLSQLEKIINQRKNNSSESSYTASLFKKGINKIAQKVGEEAVELVIEAKDNNNELFLNESADLIYHFLVLLSAKGFSLNDVEKILIDRHKK